ncbi:chromosome partitioning protein ParB [Phenylobacterium hankyongense]|uniref:Chromosome-partitioning protein ParB n=1 Tax=Phenylobacterium hankyongense TaxID=1813876 RepID=A0A328B9K6_9CAUL|nr:ParB/RepB/Spo0J family partition protein [Phenylobacterium hankyongense]RAK61708.1 chromosome partitioning protein ParB [Phenylobacterium hankyongense]
MAEGRRGLGRGLSALLGEAEEGAEGATATGGVAGEGVREIPIELIYRNLEQPRQYFSEADLAELETSIRDKGVLQPILVRPSRAQPGQFEIVAGERRWRAAQRVGLKTIPALVRELGDNQAFEIAIVENVQRSDLNAMEEARAYMALMGRMGYTQDQAANSVGKSRSHVANTVRLLQLPHPVQEHVLNGRLTAGHARAILASDDQERIAEQVVARGLSVRDTEALVRAKAAGPKKASGPRRAAKDADTAALETDLEDALGMSVDILDRGGAGELKIKYATLEQLDEICRRLTRT